jgi:hypothetical protein
MNNRRIRFSPVELVLVVFLVFSLLLGFLQARREEIARQQRAGTRERG